MSLSNRVQVKDNHTYIIKVSTNLQGDNYWVRIRRNNQYVPYKNQQGQSKANELNAILPITPSKFEEWRTVASKKKEKDKSIYYWVVESHNLFDRRNKSYRLYFTDPDSTQIENVDQTNYMAINDEGQLRLLHVQLKHNGMKMNPTFFIARSIKQIEDALKYVKYCVVKVENNEQKLIEKPEQMQDKLPFTPTNHGQSNDHKQSNDHEQSDDHDTDHNSEQTNGEDD